MAEKKIKTEVENLSMIISVTDDSILEHQIKSEVADTYSVNIKSVLVPIGEGFIRQTGTEISPGSALEVDGKKVNVLKLYAAAMTKKQ